MHCAIGIDLGGSCIKGIAVTPEGQDLAKTIIDFDAEQMDWAQKIRGVVGQLQNDVGSKGRSFCVGLSAPGLAAADGRSIAHMPGRLQGLEGLDWTKFLGGTTPVP